MSIALEGRAAVVTGAASGIGRSLALEAARRGMGLAIADVDEPGLRETADQVRAIGVPVMTAQVDVRRRAEVAAFADGVFGTYASVALVLANAGVLRAGSTACPDLDALDLMIDVNLRGAAHTLAAFVDRMGKQAQPSRFVITGSEASVLTYRNLGGYTATKHALWALAESLKFELEAEASSVGVSLLCPGSVRSAIAERRDGSATSTLEIEMSRRLAEHGMDPDEVARIAFDAVQREQFWIFTHEAFKAPLRDRFDRVLSASDPRPPAPGRLRRAAPRWSGSVARGRPDG